MDTIKLLRFLSLIYINNIPIISTKPGHIQKGNTMQNLDELFENLNEFVKNFEILIQKNVFNNQYNDSLRNFGNDIISLCKSKRFNITSNDLLSLDSFNELFTKTNVSSKGYLVSQVENFYTEVIEPTKDEYYHN